ncbi:WHG domain-containing protein, partial [archaeon]|nr:WHG domain-containing protein [archaeon]
CSARVIANRMQSSTMPIYSCLSSMKELEDAVRKKAVDLLVSYSTKVRTGNVFLDMGVGYIMFAKSEKHLFRMLFLSEAREESVDLRRRFKEYVVSALLEKLTDFEPLKEFSEERKRKLMDRSWVFNHGLAMLLNNSLIDDLDEKQVAELLLDNGIFMIVGEGMRDKIYKNRDVKRFLKMSGFEYLSEQKGTALRFSS